MKKIVNGFFIGLGFFFVGLGAVGIALPVLPATPFLVLATICFAKGSKKFPTWFLQTGLYKKYVEPAVHKKEMSKNAKRKTLCTLCLIFLISFLVVPIWYVKGIIFLVALFHIYYFTFKIRTAKTEEKKLEMAE